MKGMRVLNGVLVVVWGAGSIVTLSKGLGDLWAFAGSLVGVIVWTAPYYYAWRAFGPTATLKVVSIARRWNIGILVGMGVLACGLAALAVINDSPVGLIAFVLAILVIAVPAALNIRALRGRIVELTGITAASQPREQAIAAIP